MAVSRSKKARKIFFKHNFFESFTDEEKELLNDWQAYQVHHIVEWSEYNSNGIISETEVNDYRNLVLIDDLSHRDITSKTNSTRSTNIGFDDQKSSKFYEMEFKSPNIILLKDISGISKPIELKMRSEIVWDFDKIPLSEFLEYNKYLLEKISK